MAASPSSLSSLSDSEDDTRDQSYRPGGPKQRGRASSSSKPRPPPKPSVLQAAQPKKTSMTTVGGSSQGTKGQELEDPKKLLEVVDQLKFFLASAPAHFYDSSSSSSSAFPADLPSISKRRGKGKQDESSNLHRFLLPTGEFVSCVWWNGLCYISGTDIVRALNFRFLAFGRPVKNTKKFEEGCFSDLRNLKSGTDAVLEEPKSEFLEFLFKHNVVRTQKKQKVFYWFSVPHDRLFLDALDRDLKREKLGLDATTDAVREPALSFHWNPSFSLYEQFAAESQAATGEAPSAPDAAAALPTVATPSLPEHPPVGGQKRGRSVYSEDDAEGEAEFSPVAGVEPPATSAMTTSAKAPAGLPETLNAGATGERVLGSVALFGGAASYKKRAKHQHPLPAPAQQRQWHSGSMEATHNGGADIVPRISVPMATMRAGPDEVFATTSRNSSRTPSGASSAASQPDGYPSVNASINMPPLLSRTLTAPTIPISSARTRTTSSTSASGLGLGQQQQEHSHSYRHASTTYLRSVSYQAPAARKIETPVRSTWPEHGHSARSFTAPAANSINITTASHDPRSTGTPLGSPFDPSTRIARSSSAFAGTADAYQKQQSQQSQHISKVWKGTPRPPQPYQQERESSYPRMDTASPAPSTWVEAPAAATTTIQQGYSSHASSSARDGGSDERRQHAGTRHWSLPPMPTSSSVFSAATEQGVARNGRYEFPAVQRAPYSASIAQRSYGGYFDGWSQSSGGYSHVPVEAGQGYVPRPDARSTYSFPAHTERPPSSAPISEDVNMQEVVYRRDELDPFAVLSHSNSSNVSMQSSRSTEPSHSSLVRSRLPSRAATPQELDHALTDLPSIAYDDSHDNMEVTEVNISGVPSPYLHVAYDNAGPSTHGNRPETPSIVHTRPVAARSYSAADANTINTSSLFIHDYTDPSGSTSAPASRSVWEQQPDSEMARSVFDTPQHHRAASSVEPSPGKTAKLFKAFTHSDDDDPLEDEHALASSSRYEHTGEVQVVKTSRNTAFYIDRPQSASYPSSIAT